VSIDGPEGDEGDDATHAWLHDTEGNFIELVDRGTPKRRPQDDIEVIRLDRVEYESEDLRETEWFYANALGFEVAGRGRSAEGNPCIDFRVPHSGQVFRFHRVERPSIQTTGTFRGNHLAFYVPKEEFEAACLQLEENGIIQHDERGDSVHGDLRIVRRPPGQGEGTYFTDPNGYKLQYIAHAGTYLDEQPERTGGGRPQSAG